MITNGKKVRLSYELTADGKPFKIVNPGKPVSYVHGKNSGEFPKAISKGLAGMKLGERKSIHLTPVQGYGAVKQTLFMTMPRKRFAHRYHFIGRQVVSEQDGKHLAFVKEVHKDSIVLDFNHPLAGKKLQYDIFVVGIEGEGMVPQKLRGNL